MPADASNEVVADFIRCFGDLSNEQVSQIISEVNSEMEQSDSEHLTMQEKLDQLTFEQVFQIQTRQLQENTS